MIFLKIQLIKKQSVKRAGQASSSGGHFDFLFKKKDKVNC
jgi:hypothetical protein